MDKSFEWLTKLRCGDMPSFRPTHTYAFHIRYPVELPVLFRIFPCDRSLLVGQNKKINQYTMALKESDEELKLVPYNCRIQRKTLSGRGRERLWAGSRNCN
jgi:hypothetical protein